MRVCFTNRSAIHLSSCNQKFIEPKEYVQSCLLDQKNIYKLNVCISVLCITIEKDKKVQ